MSATVRAVAFAGYAVALGVLSADGWRWHPALLGELASLQAMWALGAWGSGTGGLAARAPTGGTVEASAVGHTLMAAVLVAEPGFVLSRLSSFADPGSLVTALAALVVLAAGLVALAVRRSGPRPVLVATGVAVLSVPLAGAAFLALEHGFGYLTV